MNSHHKKKSPTPRSLHFRMPAEWEPHEATWLAWPTDPETFPAEVLPRVEQTYAAMIRALLPGEAVHVLVDDDVAAACVRDLCGLHPNLHCDVIRTQDVWIRDYGPTFVTDGHEVAMNVWRYNAYGEKYDALKADDAVALQINERLNLRTFEPNLFLEGGAIEVNGAGLCLTTELCLLNENRNTHASRAEMEQHLRDYLNITDVLWLGGGLEGDDTDGHIDNLARFVDANTIVCCREENSSDKNFAALDRDWRRLQDIAHKHALTVLPLPMPCTVLGREGTERLPASYANFYIGNSAVLVPQYGCAQDRQVLEMLRPFFPTREVVGIDARALVWGYGSIHCVTQQQPKP